MARPCETDVSAGAIHKRCFHHSGGNMMCMLHRGVTAALATAVTIATFLAATAVAAAFLATSSLAYAAGSPRSVPVAGADRWVLASSGEIALVAGGEPHPGALLGIQCAGPDLRSHRIAFGALRHKDRSGLLSVLATRQTTFLHIAIETQTMRAAFVTGIEERTALDHEGKADLVVADLTREQYDLMRTATTLAITAGASTVRFTGKGSAAATAGSRCTRNTPAPPGGLVRADGAQEPGRPLLTPWTFRSELLAADPSEGRYAASTSTVGYASDPLARFEFTITCHAHRLYAAFTRGSVAQNGSGSSGGKAEKSATATAASESDTFAEIYSDGRVIARFSVAIDATGKGHRLNAHELTALLDFSNIVVRAPRLLQPITFTSDEGPQAIVMLAETCGTRADQTP